MTAVRVRPAKDVVAHPALDQLSTSPGQDAVVAVTVGVSVGVGVAVGVGIGVGVAVGVGIAVAVGVGVGTGVSVAEGVGVDVGTPVGVGVGWAQATSSTMPKMASGRTPLRNIAAPPSVFLPSPPLP